MLNDNRFSFKANLLLALAAGLNSLPSQAENNGVPPDQACIYQETNLEAYGGKLFQNPEEVRSENGKLHVNLDVVYTDPEKTKIAGCGVKLRSYNGKLVGPTLRVKPGDTLYITLNNKLGPMKPGMKLADICDNPHDIFGGSPLPENFNCTNLHTHGLHVSPSGDSDNVLITIPPIPNKKQDGDNSTMSSNPRQIVIKIPENHSPGTEWYHPHVHGMTGIQVASGMEGAIIVEDVNPKTPESLKIASDIMHEKVFMLQTIPYDDTGKVDDFLALGDDRAFVRNRYLLVNGQIAPTIKMHPGEVQRWRFIDSSFNRNFQLSLEKHNLNEIAVDGNYLSQVDTWVNNWEEKDYCCTGKWDQERTFKLKRQSVEIIPGARSDVLVKANAKPGRYKLMADTYISGRLDPSIASYSNYVVAFVDVEGDAVADTGIPTNDEMKNILYPYKNINNSNVKYNQLAVFNRDQPQGGNDGGIACDPIADNTTCYPIGFQVNGHSFNMNDLPRQLQLSPEKLQTEEGKQGPQTGTDQWIITSNDQERNHVFHIHTNDFQTTRNDPLGHPETLWRDSLLVQYGNPQTILTRYEDFDGTTVMHCHLLSHEDMGMMQAIQFKKVDAQSHSH